MTKAKKIIPGAYNHRGFHIIKQGRKWIVFLPVGGRIISPQPIESVDLASRFIDIFIDKIRAKLRETR